MAAKNSKARNAGKSSKGPPGHTPTNRPVPKAGSSTGAPSGVAGTADAGLWAGTGTSDRSAGWRGGPLPGPLARAMAELPPLEVLDPPRPEPDPQAGRPDLPDPVTAGDASETPQRPATPPAALPPPGLIPSAAPAAPRPSLPAFVMPRSFDLSSAPTFSAPPPLSLPVVRISLGGRTVRAAADAGHALAAGDQGVTPTEAGESTISTTTPTDLSTAAANTSPHLTDLDIFLFREGKHHRLYQRLGAHPAKIDGRSGTWFAVWAPNAREVSVIGDFNGWQAASDPLSPRPDGSGIWEGFVTGASVGHCYKYRITSTHLDAVLEKADPFAFATECPPATASRISSLEDHAWADGQWMAERHQRNALDAPISTYEMHLGSWMRPEGDPRGFLGYREIASRLGDYLVDLGFTHVELMPVTEHPFYGSWGYQTLGYFAPSARYGTPEDFMAFVDHLHQRGIGVILDWVPSHFPGDDHGLARFDGTPLFEHADPREGFHPDWKSWIFNYGRYEVRSFLISSALFWLDRYHIDGLRVDAVASMLYRDYGRRPGEWIPNVFGGHENFEAVSLLRELNESAYRDYPDIQMIAEESTAWPGVSRPVYNGGLGFGMKWNMGWMHDTLSWFREDPVNRRHHQDKLTFGLVYAFTENFMLSLSHDEVVYGKGSLLGKMPGDDWQKFANLRLLFGLQWAHPGKKLIFMGGELGQRSEWNHEGSLDWESLADSRHRGVQRWIEDLNRVYREQPALHRIDFDAAGFEWVDASDSGQSVLSFLRKAGPRAGQGRSAAAAAIEETVLVVVNGTPVPRHNYSIGVPRAGHWTEILNSDAPLYGGSGQGNFGGVNSVPLPAHGRMHALTLTLPPLSVVMFRAPDA